MAHSLHHPLKATIWLLLSLSLVACAAVTNTPDEASRTADAGPNEQSDAAPTPTPFLLAAESLPDMGQAPDFNNEVWLNADAPLNLAALRGKVVLVEFWTFG